MRSGMISRSTVVNSVTLRKSFKKGKSVVSVPNLIEVQSKSFNDFVQLDYLIEERKGIGLEKALRDVFPVEYGDKFSLEYVGYELGDWACSCGKLTGFPNRYTWTCSKTGETGISRLANDEKSKQYVICTDCRSRVGLKVPLSVQECRDGEETYSFPLRVKVQLVAWEIDESGEKIIHDIKEQDVFFSDLPVMVDVFEKDGRYCLGSQGTFVINGVDRVVVSQLHRSPGAVFSKSKKTKDLQGKPYFTARIIPMRGSWLDFEFDTSDCLYVRIDKKKKVLVTTFLQSLGIPREEILSSFYESDVVFSDKGHFYKKIDDNLIGFRFDKDMLPSALEKTYLGRRVNKATLDELKKAKVERINIPQSYVLNKVVRTDAVDAKTGELLLEQGASILENNIITLGQCKDVKIDLVNVKGYVFQPTMAVTLSHDPNRTIEDALRDLHAKVWPGDSSSIWEGKERLERQFFQDKYYDLTRVGRIRLNEKLGISVPEDVAALTRDDIVGVVRYLVNLRERGEGELDDIDHLGNRRVRLVGELLTNQMYVGLSRIDRIAKERFRMQELHGALMPQDFLNVKPLSAVLREFFGSGQLSQFMDQTNPLSELAHKRRLSALGPGGVMKDRATHEVRDVHTSHYGRICPIETPEGQTIGLISSLATYAMVNDLGFIESAYRPVKDGKIQDEAVFLNAFVESNYQIAQFDSVDDSGKKFVADKVVARKDGNFTVTDVKDIDYVDVSSQQLVSVAAALIPFLEHDDASRALMGANMQRQAVPLLRPQVPLVGTGMECEVAKSSGTALAAKFAGTVRHVSSDQVIVVSERSLFDTDDQWLDYGVQTYDLTKFHRSSYSTWIHQHPIVAEGDKVEVGDFLTDGSSIENGELALGTNLTVAFMPWSGYNFEDAIVLSKRLVAEDVLTSVNMEEYSVEARDTKLGPEEITKDIPNVGEKALESLDEHGIVRIGTRVSPGTILVGKVTLKGDVQFSPEEKLLRAIFGEKSREVRDTSLRVSPGVEGTVVDVKVFFRGGARKDKRYKDVALEKIEKLTASFNKQVESLKHLVSKELIKLLTGEKPGKAKYKSLLTGGVFDKKKLVAAEVEELLECTVKDSKVMDKVVYLRESFENRVQILESLKEEKGAAIKKGDKLPSGVIKIVKVYIASKRAISVGDKIAGRHGNKGIISNIVPIEDMPFLDDGRAVDIILNPLGVPSRMNVGQILETILGFAGKKLGEKLQGVIDNQGYDYVVKFLTKTYGKECIDEFVKNHTKNDVMQMARRTAESGVCFKTPIFQGVSFDKEMVPLMDELNLNDTGTYKIRDGRTGRYFDQPVTVGIIYMIKLIHMADDKLHARSVGPYSLITQQPLRGKAQFGGQRFGEMEVWALYAYGTAYALQEMLTYKSDDVTGRHKVYESIVRGDKIPDPGLPESFNVLVKELQSLGLQVDLFKSEKEELSE
jgi:DNA-directed RNA polymerase subunit beta